MQEQPADKKQPDAVNDASGENPATDEDPEAEPPKEIGGRPGPEPTRYGDWEKNGRCIDF